MGKFYKNIINEKRKTLTWKNTNFCYVTTIVFMLVLVATFLWCRPAIDEILKTNIKWNIILRPFRHVGGWVHLIGNLASFLVVSLFLERRYGSIKYALIILITIPLSPLADFAIMGFNFYNGGESLVNFFLFGLFFIEILFNFKECFLTKYQNIFTIITIFLIFLLMSFTIKLEFSPFVTLFTVNHGSAFIEGLLVGILSNLVITKRGHYEN
ncbi:MAG: rhomboid family intramembrane serine protease [Candidatus Caccovivens sp.]